MLEARLYRDTHLPDATLGSLVVGGQFFRTIERPWLDNAANVSCIPVGEYDCDFMARSGSGKYKNCWWLRSVPDRSGVLIHNGNLARHSRGCIILGLRRGWIGRDAAVLNSRSAMAALLDIVGPDPMRLIIEGEK